MSEPIPAAKPISQKLGFRATAAKTAATGTLSPATLAPGIANPPTVDGCESQAGEPERDEGGAPADMRGDEPPNNDSERAADRNAEREQGQRPGPPLGRIEIADQRIGRRHSGSLADADRHPGEEQLDEIRGQPAQRRGQAP